MDPLWEPTFRFFAVWPYAVKLSREIEFVQSFARGCYCDGIDFGTDNGMKLIVERAGLAYGVAKQLTDDDMKHATVDSQGDDSRLRNETAAASVQIMRDDGLWGVPCIQFGKRFVWGQDRLWAIEQAIMESY